MTFGLHDDLVSSGGSFALGSDRVQSLAQTPIPLVVRERAGVVEIVAGHVVLLSTAALETERAFGRLASLAAHASVGAPLRVLVGGLGFGASVRGVLEVVGDAARVTVVERVAGIETLVRGELAHVAGDPLTDSRVTVAQGDVADFLAANEGGYDAILLDVDNGPHWATFRSNARLYSASGLAVSRRALRPGGAFAVWSGYRADAFRARLQEAGFVASIVPLRERGRIRARAYVGVRPR